MQHRSSVKKYHSRQSVNVEKPTYKRDMKRENSFVCKTELLLHSHADVLLLVLVSVRCHVLSGGCLSYIVI